MASQSTLSYRGVKVADAERQQSPLLTLQVDVAAVDPFAAQLKREIARKMCGLHALLGTILHPVCKYSIIAYTLVVGAAGVYTLFGGTPSCKTPRSLLNPYAIDWSMPLVAASAALALFALGSRQREGWCAQLALLALAHAVIKRRREGATHQLVVMPNLALTPFMIRWAAYGAVALVAASVLVAIIWAIVSPGTYIIQGTCSPWTGLTGACISAWFSVFGISTAIAASIIVPVSLSVLVFNISLHDHVQSAVCACILPRSLAGVLHHPRAGSSSSVLEPSGWQLDMVLAAMAAEHTTDVLAGEAQGERFLHPHAVDVLFRVISWRSAHIAISTTSMPAFVLSAGGCIVTALFTLRQLFEHKLSAEYIAYAVGGLIPAATIVSYIATTSNRVWTQAATVIADTTQPIIFLPSALDALQGGHVAAAEGRDIIEFVLSSIEDAGMQEILADTSTWPCCVTTQRHRGDRTIRVPISRVVHNTRAAPREEAAPEIARSLCPHGRERCDGCPVPLFMPKSYGMCRLLQQQVTSWFRDEALIQPALMSIGIWVLQWRFTSDDLVTPLLSLITAGLLPLAQTIISPEIGSSSSTSNAQSSGT